MSAITKQATKLKMSLITKQIADLRAYASTRKGELAKMISDAADTIEALSARQERIVDAIKAADINGWVKDDLLGRIEAGAREVQKHDQRRSRIDTHKT